MRCPQCGQANREGASICQGCDYILDDSFLAETGGDERADGEDTGVRRAPPPEVDTQSGPPPVPRRARQETPAPRAPAPAAKPARRGSRFIPTKQGMEDDDPPPEPAQGPRADPDDDWREELRRERESRAAEERRQAEAAPPPKPGQREEDRVVGDLKAVFSKGKGAYQGLERPDQISLAGAGGMFLMCFFPWVSIERQGSLIGLEVGGWLLILLGACVGGAVFLRRTPHWQDRQKPIVLGQAAAAILAILLCLSKLVSLGSMKVVVPEADLELPAEAQVQFGVFLALLFSGVAAFGTWPAVRAQVLRR